MRNLLLAALLGASPARAGLFDDEEARRQIKDLSIQTGERIDTLSKAQFELVTLLLRIVVRQDRHRITGQHTCVAGLQQLDME